MTREHCRSQWTGLSNVKFQKLSSSRPEIQAIVRMWPLTITLWRLTMIPIIVFAVRLVRWTRDEKSIFTRRIFLFSSYFFFSPQKNLHLLYAYYMKVVANSSLLPPREFPL